MELLRSDAAMTLAPQVVRKHTTKQFVRDEALAASGQGFSLGTAVLAQIQYTTCSSHVWHIETEGVWVRHRFDTATTNDVPNTDGWGEVSQRVVDLLETIMHGEEHAEHPWR
jgi:hypothetical protein